MKNDPLLIGITGGIGSGKSSVCQVFKALGAPVYDADTAARRLMNESPELRLQLEAAFGQETYLNNTLNRSYLSQLVLNDPAKLTRLNAITHPAVGVDFGNWVTEHKSASYLVKEAALLIETGMYKHLDLLILVTASESIRLERVLKRDNHRNEQDVRRLMQKQMPEEEKREFCNVVIENEGFEAILPEILRLDHLFNRRILP